MLLKMIVLKESNGGTRNNPVYRQKQYGTFRHRAVPLAPHQDAQPFSRPLAAGGIMNWKSVPYGVAVLAQSFPP